MPGRDEKARRSALKKAYLRAENLRAWENMYLSRPQLSSLLAYVDAKVARDGCDHTLRYTREWASSHGINADALTENIVQVWGQGCDCEVANIGDELNL